MREKFKSLGYLDKVVGIGNKLRFVWGEEPVYDEKTLNRIAGRGTAMVLFGVPGEKAGRVRMHSWDTVNNALREAGLSAKRASEETNKRVWPLED